MPRKPKHIEDYLATKAGKYFVAVKNGKQKKAALIEAGFSPTTQNISGIEDTKPYQALQAYYRDKLLAQISMEQIAEEHIKNIVQDEDRGAKNKAIEMALDRIEPEKHKEAKEEQIVVVMAKRKE